MQNLIFDNQRHLRNGWWVILFFLGMAALVVPATVLASSKGQTVSMPVQAVIVAIVTLAFLAIRREWPSTVFGKLSTWPAGVAAGIGLAILMWGSTAALLWATGAMSWSANANVANALMLGLVDSLAVAVAEELIFRGFIFQRLISGTGTIPAQLALAAYFTLNHAGGLSQAGDVKYIGMANIFLASLMFGAAYLRTRSLALPIALHFALNFVQGTILGFGVSGNETSGVLVPQLSAAPDWWTGGAFGLEASLPGTLAVIVVLLFLSRRRVERSAAPLGQTGRG